MDLVMIAALFSALFGYYLAWMNPLDFDTFEAHVLLSTIFAIGCALAAAGLYVLSL